MKKNRKYFLDEAEKLINGPRAKEYGPAKFNHERIAKIWSVILARDVTAQEVVACMVMGHLLKVFLIYLNTKQFL